MVLCECACANLISKANSNLLDRTDLSIRLHIMFQVSFQSSKGQKSYRKFLGVRSELLLSINVLIVNSEYMQTITFLYDSLDPRHYRTNNKTYVPNHDSDQPGQSHR